MPRKKKTDSPSKNTVIVKKKRGRKKKKTLNNDDMIIIDFKKDINSTFDTINHNTNNKKENNTQNELNINTSNNETNDMTSYSSDLILHLKTNDKNIIGANINNDTHFAPFNNNNNSNNNSSFNISSMNNNSSFNISLINNNTNNNSNNNSNNSNTSKNIFSFIKSSKTINSNSKNNLNSDLQSEYKYTRNDNINNNLNNNLNNTNNISLNQDLQKIMRKNIRKIKYSFDNNRKWLCKSNVHCLWCCHKFDNIPIAIPKKVCGDTFHLFGYFCSFNCAASYIFETSVLASNKWEYYSLLCLLQKKITGDKIYKKINFAPPRECLKMFGGFLSIDEFREQFNLVDYNVMLPPMIPIESTIENSIVQR